MTISLDSYHRTGNITTNTDYTQSLTPSGTIIGVVFFLTNPVISDGIDSVWWGGVRLRKMDTGNQYSTHQLSVNMWMLDRLVPQGNQNLIVRMGNNSGASFREGGTAVGHTYFLAGSGDGIRMVDCGKLAGGASPIAANPSITLDSGAETAIRLICMQTGLDAPADHALVAGYTSDNTDDWGSMTARVGHQTTPSSGAVAAGYTCASSDGVVIAGAFVDGGADTAEVNNWEPSGTLAHTTESDKTGARTFLVQPKALMVFASNVTNGNDVLTSVDWDGVPMTEVHNITDGTYRTWSFYMLNPNWDGSSKDFTFHHSGGNASTWLQYYVVPVIGDGEPYLMDSDSLNTASGTTYFTALGDTSAPHSSAYGGMIGFDYPAAGWNTGGETPPDGGSPTYYGGWRTGTGRMAIAGGAAPLFTASNIGYTDVTNRSALMGALAIGFTQASGKRKQMLLLS